MTRTCIALAACAALIPAAALAQDKGGETRDGIIAMGDGDEIFMDPRAPEDRDGIINMGDGDTIFMDRRRPEDRDGVVWEEDDID
jgi:hypothetical protein